MIKQKKIKSIWELLNEFHKLRREKTQKDDYLGEECEDCDNCEFNTYPERLHEIICRHLNIQQHTSMETEIALLIDEIICKEAG